MFSSNKATHNALVQAMAEMRGGGSGRVVSQLLALGSRMCSYKDLESSDQGSVNGALYGATMRTAADEIRDLVKESRRKDREIRRLVRVLNKIAGAALEASTRDTDVV